MIAKDTRCWRYRENESRIFDSPESVPANEGWVDSPAKVRDASNVVLLAPPVPAEVVAEIKKPRKGKAS